MVAKRTQRQAAPVFLPRVIAAVANDELAPEVLTTARGLAAEASEPLLVAHAVAADTGGTLVGRRPAGRRHDAVAALVRHAPAPVVAVSTPDAAD